MAVTVSFETFKKEAEDKIYFKAFEAA